MPPRDGNSPQSYAATPGVAPFPICNTQLTTEESRNLNPKMRLVNQSIASDSRPCSKLAIVMRAQTRQSSGAVLCRGRRMWWAIRLSGLFQDHHLAGSAWRCFLYEVLGRQQLRHDPAKKTTIKPRVSLFIFTPLSTTIAENHHHSHQTLPQSFRNRQY